MSNISMMNISSIRHVVKRRSHLSPSHQGNGAKVYLNLKCTRRVSTNRRAGRCEEVDMTYLRGWFTGPITRTPMMYQKFKKDKDWLGNLVPDGRLKNTNETVHPSVRYRRFCQNPGGLGPKDSGQYNPDALRGWAWPTISDKGRAGGYRILEGKEVVVREKEEMIMPESIMGKYEKILLAIYDQDLKIEGRNDSIWEQVMGGT